MTTTEVKSYNVYGQEEGDETLFYLERLDLKKQSDWYNCGAFKTPRKVAREIVECLSLGGRRIDFYKLELPDITNASPKVSKRDYGVIFGGFHGFRFEKPTIIRALSPKEFRQIPEELDYLREKAKGLHELVQRLTEKDGKIDPNYFQRILWEKQLDLANYQGL